ncbi:16090_t:CDS:1 [Dentiscutata heterogama]|uniref:16090_t:CDS:1 n=1 Tax=Dentiscutata heterogama TaxID=1316150 RepID=A0ACA9K2E0_9GLOM|nr:16090_t:CDS:1 [Dentiscutata heterogama]
MPQQKIRSNSTLACVNCKWRHVRCEKFPRGDACKNCRKYNRFCIYMPGNKRGPKHKQNTRSANPKSLSNINPYEEAYIQYWKQFTLNIEDSSYPVPEAAYAQYQLMPSVDSILYQIPRMAYTQYQEQFTSNIENSSHPLSETTDFQNKFINESTLLSSSFDQDELMPNDEQHIISSSNISTSNLNNFFPFKTQDSNNNIGSYDTIKAFQNTFQNTFVDQSTLILSSSFVHEQSITSSFNSLLSTLYPNKYSSFSISEESMPDNDLSIIIPSQNVIL